MTAGVDAGSLGDGHASHDFSEGCAIAKHAANTGLIADNWFSVNQAFSFDAGPVAIVPELRFSSSEARKV